MSFRSAHSNWENIFKNVNTFRNNETIALYCYVFIESPCIMHSVAAVLGLPSLTWK